MTRATCVHFVGTAEGQGATRALLQGLDDAAIDHRGVPRSLVMRCPDGCGQMLSVNLDSRSGKAWRLYGKGDQLTLFPSDWRDDGCKAHFIVWKNRIIWCDARGPVGWDDPTLVARVGQILVAASPRAMDYEDIALRLGEIPWEVLWARHALVRAKVASRRTDAEFYVAKP